MTCTVECKTHFLSIFWYERVEAMLMEYSNTKYLIKKGCYFKVKNIEGGKITDNDGVIYKNTKARYDNKILSTVPRLHTNCHWKKNTDPEVSIIEEASGSSSTPKCYKENQMQSLKLSS